MAAASSRLDWLRDGVAGDGNPANNKASLLMPKATTCRVRTRRPTVAAPPMDLMGALVDVAGEGGRGR